MRRWKVALSILIVAVLIAISFYVYLWIGSMTCCAPPPSTSSSQSGPVTTQPYPPPTTSETTTLQNGVAEYAYPTSNLSSSISAKVGETFIIQLSSNAGSTGYDWNVTSSSGIRYLNYTVVSTSNLVGGPQLRNYFFRAVEAGNQTIALRDQRLFAPYYVAATINLQVTVS